MTDGVVSVGPDAGPIRRDLGPLAWIVLEELVLRADEGEDGELRSALGVRELARALGISKDTAARARDSTYDLLLGSADDADRREAQSVEPRGADPDGAQRSPRLPPEMQPVAERDRRRELEDDDPVGADDAQELLHVAEDVRSGREVLQRLIRDRRPALLLWADADPVLPLESFGRQMQRVLAMADELTVIRDAGHYLQEDQGDLVGRTIAAWLAGVAH